MAEPDQPKSRPQSPSTVAVIGDDAGLSYLLRRMFELSGLAVVSGYPGQFEGDPGRALRFFDEREVRVAVWRLDRGDISGWALTHLLRERLTPSGRALLIVADDPAALATQVGAAAAAACEPLGRDVSSLARLAAAVERIINTPLPAAAGASQAFQSGAAEAGDAEVSGP